MLLIVIDACEIKKGNIDYVKMTCSSLCVHYCIGLWNLYIYIYATVSDVWMMVPPNIGICACAR